MSGKETDVGRVGVWLQHCLRLGFACKGQQAILDSNRGDTVLVQELPGHFSLQLFPGGKPPGIGVIVPPDELNSVLTQQRSETLMRMAQTVEKRLESDARCGALLADALRFQEPPTP